MTGMADTCPNRRPKAIGKNSASSMQVLFVSETHWMEGVVFDLHVLAEGLVRLGHKVYAIDPGRGSEVPFPPREVTRVFPNATVELRSPYMPSFWLDSYTVHRSIILRRLYEAYRRHVAIKEFLANEKIDIIVLYSGVNAGFQTARLARKHGIPVIFRNVDKLYNLWPTRMTRFVAKKIEKHVYPKMDKLLALTPKYAEYMVQLGGDERKVELLVFPIDTDKFHPSVDDSQVRRQWGIKKTDQCIVFVGTLYPFGGMIEFIRQFPSILKDAPRAKLLVVGGGPVLPEITKIVAELQLEKRVVLTNYQPFDQMPQYINAATICLNVFPINSRTSDIFSAKIVQYLSCGKATVSSALPGITTLLDSESSGVVFANTIEDLVREVAALLKSPKRRRKLGAVGRKYIEQNFSYDRIILKLERELRSVLESKSRKP